MTLTTRGPQTLSALARWRDATKRLHRSLGWRVLDHLYDRALREGRILEVVPAEIAETVQLQAVAQVYHALNILDARDLIAIVGKPARGQRGLPWRIEVPAEFLDIWRQDAPRRSLTVAAPGARVAAEAPTRVGSTRVQVAVVYVAPAEKGFTVAGQIADYLTKLGRELGIEREGSITLTITFGDDSSQQRVG